MLLLQCVAVCHTIHSYLCHDVFIRYMALSCMCDMTCAYNIIFCIVLCIVFVNCVLYLKKNNLDLYIYLDQKTSILHLYVECMRRCLLLMSIYTYVVLQRVFSLYMRDSYQMMTVIHRNMSIHTCIVSDKAYILSKEH